jgi:hypothetical protein
MGRTQRRWVARCKRPTCGYTFAYPNNEPIEGIILQYPQCKELRRYHKGEIFLLRVREKIMSALVCRIPR